MCRRVSEQNESNSSDTTDCNDLLGLSVMLSLRLIASSLEASAMVALM